MPQLSFAPVLPTGQPGSGLMLAVAAFALVGRPALVPGATYAPPDGFLLTPLLIADIMNDAVVPAGVVNIVTGTGA